MLAPVPANVNLSSLGPKRVCDNCLYIPAEALLPLTPNVPAEPLPWKWPKATENCDLAVESVAGLAA